MKKKIIISIISFLLFILIGAVAYYSINLGPVSKDKKEVIVVINKGSNMTSIASLLAEKKIIKNKNIFLLFVKLNKLSAQAGTYRFFTNESSAVIAHKISEGKVFELNYWLKLIEGKTLKNYASQYAKNTNMTETQVIDYLSDKNYLQKLIDKYWFLTVDILNPDLYFPLEGYLFPDTYQFRYDDNLETIINKQLDTLNNKLSKFKNKIQNDKLNVHDLLTMASMVELEANTKEERDLVAGVFYNRLRKNESLGSDVTTYYAEQVELGSVKDLYQYQYNAKNAYNTRNLSMIGLPVGPICNPSLTSIEAAINPAKTDYYFFWADQSGKIYFTKTNQEHNEVQK